MVVWEICVCACALLLERTWRPLVECVSEWFDPENSTRSNKRIHLGSRREDLKVCAQFHQLCVLSPPTTSTPSLSLSPRFCDPNHCEDIEFCSKIVFSSVCVCCPVSFLYLPPLCSRSQLVSSNILVSNVYSRSIDPPPVCLEGKLTIDIFSALILSIFLRFKLS